MWSLGKSQMSWVGDGENKGVSAVLDLLLWCAVTLGLAAATETGGRHASGGMCLVGG